MIRKTKTVPSPVDLTYIYRKLEDKSINRIVTIDQVKETITRCLLVAKTGGKNGLGGCRKGIPRVHLYDIIHDLCNYGALERIDYKKFKIIRPEKKTILKVDWQSGLNRLKKFPF